MGYSQNQPNMRLQNLQQRTSRKRLQNRFSEGHENNKVLEIRDSGSVNEVRGTINIPEPNMFAKSSPAAKPSKFATTETIAIPTKPMRPSFVKPNEFVIS